ncbi:hypothetical protein VTI74DRAFT_7065 [Chaetomium olivicolor]
MPTKPRERTVPLVPEPFRNLAISRQSVFLRTRPAASAWGRFCPNLNILQYREPLSEEKKRKRSLIKEQPNCPDEQLAISVTSPPSSVGKCVLGTTSSV